MEKFIKPIKIKGSEYDSFGCPKCPNYKVKYKATAINHIYKKHYGIKRVKLPEEAKRIKAYLRDIKRRIEIVKKNEKIIDDLLKK